MRSVGRPIAACPVSRLSAVMGEREYLDGSVDLSVDQVERKARQADPSKIGRADDSRAQWCLARERQCRPKRRVVPPAESGLTLLVVGHLLAVFASGLGVQPVVHRKSAATWDSSFSAVTRSTAPRSISAARRAASSSHNSETSLSVSASRLASSCSANSARWSRGRDRACRRMSSMFVCRQISRHDSANTDQLLLIRSY